MEQDIILTTTTNEIQIDLVHLGIVSEILQTKIIVLIFVDC